MLFLRMIIIASEAGVYFNLGLCAPVAVFGGMFLIPLEKLVMRRFFHK